MSSNETQPNPFTEQPPPPLPAAMAPPSLGHRAVMALKQGNLLLVALMLAGLAGVYLLSLRGGPATASAEQVEDEMRVDAALVSLKHMPTGGLGSQKSQTIVEMFHHQARQKQVPAGELVSNPFVYKLPGVEQTSSPEPDQKIRVEADLSGPAALAAVKQLKLQSVLMGSRPSENLAMISNNLLAVGQDIGGWTVRKIESNRVSLSWREQEYVLEMPR